MVFNELSVDEQRTRKGGDMKILTSMIPVFVLCVGLTLPAFAADETVSGGTFSQEAAVQSVDFHMTAIQQHLDKAGMLEQKIEKLENRLDMFKNSYRDPKGFKRASWKRLIGTWLGELKDIREHVVWHEDQIDRLKT